jgi:deoxyribodipyrimidine photo-lyase
MIPGERIRTLNSHPVRAGRYVLYWMQSSQRSRGNLALEYAIERANAIGVPVLACFCVDTSYPEANLRHFSFMAEGLCAVGKKLEERGIPFMLLRGTPAEKLADSATDAALVVTDRGYLALHRQWRERVAQVIGCPLVQVEDNVVVPVEAASGKEEWSAGTIRMKIHRQMMRFLKPLESGRVQYRSPSLDGGGIPYQEAGDIILGVQERFPGPSPLYRGGEDEALQRLDEFITGGLARYPALHSDPGISVLSGMSPYLHFGQISPMFIVQRVLESGQAGTEEYLEELIIRRELSMNFVTYNPFYDTYGGLPDWARRTLEEHAEDPREHIYSRSEFEEARTDDPYWNAAQQELLITGKMHGYMRMYWGKKILEWSETPEQAFRTALSLNNRYELDGRDPNGYTGVAWCFGKHDRAWGERPVFGKVRYMNAAGLKRKFQINRYLDRMETLAEEHGPAGGD